MTFEEAQILVNKHKNKDKYSRIHATSDGNIYFDSDISALEKHAIDNNIELFHIKPEKIEIKKPKKSNGS